jgi:predicted RNA-binding Zn ribbon-like protein
MELRAARAFLSEPIPDSISGWLCLAFANSVENYRLETPQDMLGSYDDLVSWSLLVKTIDEETASVLRSEASQHPDEAARVLARAKEYRAVVYRVFSGMAHGREPLQEDLDRVNQMLGRSLAHLVVSVSSDGYAWAWSSEGVDLESCLWPVAQSSADLLVSPELKRLRQCGGHSCTWLFLDRSKNHSRRWCNMGVCGNRAKSRRHYARQKSQDEA